MSFLKRRKKGIFYNFFWLSSFVISNLTCNQEKANKNTFFLSFFCVPFFKETNICLFTDLLIILCEKGLLWNNQETSRKPFRILVSLLSTSLRFYASSLWRHPLPSPFVPLLPSRTGREGEGRGSALVEKGREGHSYRDPSFLPPRHPLPVREGRTAFLLFSSPPLRRRQQRDEVQPQCP